VDGEDDSCDGARPADPGLVLSGTVFQPFGALRAQGPMRESPIVDWRDFPGAAQGTAATSRRARTR